MKPFTIFLSVLFISLFSFSQDLDEILESHFEAIGQDKIAGIDAFEYKSTVYQGGMEIPLIIYQNRPNMYKSKATVQGMDIISSYDGEQGWMINPMTGTSDPIELSGEQLKSLKERGDIDGKLYKWEEKGHKLEYTGTDEMEGTEVYVLEMETNNDEWTTFYIDTDSYLILKQVNKMIVQGAEQEMETFLSNYKETDGMVFSHSLTVKSGGNTIMSLTFDEIIFNPDIDETFFKMPEVIKVDTVPELEEKK